MVIMIVMENKKENRGGGKYKKERETTKGKSKTYMVRCASVTFHSCNDWCFRSSSMNSRRVAYPSPSTDVSLSSSPSFCHIIK